MFLVLKVFSYMLNFLPQSAVLSLGEGLGSFVFKVIKFRRSIVEENLKLAFSADNS